MQKFFRFPTARPAQDSSTSQLDGEPASNQSAADQVLEIAEDLVPTPIYISQRTRLILIAAIFVGVIWLFSMVPSVLRLLLIGATVALVLSFPVRLLQRWVPRGVAIMVVVGSTVAFAVISIILVVPYAINEMTQFAEQLPSIAENFEVQARDLLMRFYERGWIDRHPDQVIEEAQGNLLDRSQDVATQILDNALAWLTRSFSIAITSFGVIFVATYLLVDIPRFREKFVLSFSPSYRPDAFKLWSTVGDSLSRYLAGLMISIIIQGLMATIGLIILDVPYAIVLGLWMSATAILPYVGAFLGGIPAVLVALTISWKMALVVLLLYVAINQVEGNLITPRIQGSAVRVHPLVIFISVIGGSQLAGLLGAILAVPTLAVFRVLLEFMWVRLQVPGDHGHDTVLVALGGDDDGSTEIEIDADESGQPTLVQVDMNQTGGDDPEVVVRNRQGTVEIDTNPDTPVSVVAPGYAAFRPRPTVKRRAVSRKHQLPISPRRSGSDQTWSTIQSSSTETGKVSTDSSGSSPGDASTVTS